MPSSDRVGDDLVDAILEGSPIDWTAAESSSEQALRPLLRQLKVVAAVAAFARSDSASAAPALWGHLQLLERIGQGAFGEVYRAWDTRLDREVALKLLPVDCSAGDRTASAIIHEGRLLARVRHPNVVTIYGAEQISNRIGLWMEFVRGDTLEHVLQQRKISAVEAIGIGLELSHAISAVHSAGLLHRDIKTHNVVRAEDGRIVLMDFGAGRELADDASSDLAGTPLYLAPEVLNGQPATIQSDIYSLGVLLYHLVTGSYPVHARTVREVRGAHERGERTAVRMARSDVPSKLARIIERAIDPQPERRYEDAGALGAELAALKEGPRVTRLAYALGVAAVLVVCAGALVWTNRSNMAAARETATARAGVQIVPVTSLPGAKMYPALSPDGSRVVFAWDRGEAFFDLHVKRLNADETLQLTQPGEGGSFPAWSPDGRFIAFIRRFHHAPGRRLDAILVMSGLGGPERTLFSDPGLLLGSGLDWSPDGEQLVLCTTSELGQPCRLTVVSVASGERRVVTSPPAGSVGDSHPAFSPNGRSIAFVRETGSENGLYLFDLPGGAPRRLMTTPFPVRRPAWTRDGQSLIFTAYRGGIRNSLWRVSVHGGEPEPVTGTGEGASDPATARLHGRLVFVQSQMDQNLYRADLDGAAGSVTRLAATTRQDATPDISSDGSRIAFVSDRTGRTEIWVMDVSGTNAVSVTDLKTPTHPRWSPDGRHIAFSARVPGASHADIHVVDAASRLAHRLTFEASADEWPTWSADGRRIYFMSDRSGIHEVWRIPAGGGRAEQITNGGGLKAWESRDGRLVYYSTGTPAPAIWRVATSGGEPELVFRLPAWTAWGGEWVLADSGIYWFNGKASPRPAIEFFSFATGRITRAVTPSGVFDVGGGFSLSPDGRWLVFGQRDYHGSDIMMIDGFE